VLRLPGTYPRSLICFAFILALPRRTPAVASSSSKEFNRKPIAIRCALELAADGRNWASRNPSIPPVLAGEPGGSPRALLQQSRGKLRELRGLRGLPGRSCLDEVTLTRQHRSSLGIRSCFGRWGAQPTLTGRAWLRPNRFGQEHETEGYTGHVPPA
jgi:hypothetical protein